MMPTSRSRPGLTLIELLVVIFIVGVLVSLLLPAVHSVREASRRAACQDNLRQTGLALQSHASTYQALPSLYNGFLPQPRYPFDEFHFHSWRTAILPLIEQSALFSQINMSLPAAVAANQTAINVRVLTFVCPSSTNLHQSVPNINPWNDNRPVAGGQVGTAARTDYEAVGGVQISPQTKPSFYLDNFQFGAWGEPNYDAPNNRSVSYRKARLSDITDGLSNTCLVVERAGRPDLYRKGQPVKPFTNADGMEVHSVTWAISTHFPYYVFRYTNPRLISAVNEINGTGIFSFHPGGANVAMADGSVRFLKETTTLAILKALATRAGSEVMNLDGQ